MKPLFLFMYIFIICILSSCFFTSKKHFYSYKKEINVSTTISIKSNGIYLSNSKRGLNALAFYKKGLVKQVSIRDTLLEGYYKKDNIEKHFFINQNAFVSEWDLNEKELWGTYLINEDSSMIIQIFGDCRDCLFRRMVLETTVKIKNDTTLIVYPTYDYEQKKYFKQDTSIYHFHPTDFKPDSTQAWFLKKHWYKKGLHESRK